MFGIKDCQICRYDDCDEAMDADHQEGGKKRMLPYATVGLDQVSMKTPVDCGRPVTEVHAEDTQVLQQLLNKVKLCPNCQPLRQHRGRGASPGSH